MPAHKFKLEIDQGATFDITFTWMTGTNKANAVPVDLTGCDARMQLRAYVLAPDVLLELTVANGHIDLSDGADGWVRFVLDASATAAIPFGDSPPARWSDECAAGG